MNTDALEQAALAEPTTQEGRILADFAFDQERGVFVGDYDEQGFRAAIVRIEQQAAAAAVREADALRSRSVRLLMLVETLRDHIEGFHGECHCVREAALSATEPAE